MNEPKDLSPPGGSDPNLLANLASTVYRTSLGGIEAARLVDLGIGCYLGRKFWCLSLLVLRVGIGAEQFGQGNRNLGSNQLTICQR